MGLSMHVKQALTGELAPRRRKAAKKLNTAILDEFVQQTGYNRKYAPHLLSHWGNTTSLTLDGKPARLKAGTAKRRKGGRGAAGNRSTGPASSLPSEVSGPSSASLAGRSRPPHPGTDGLL